ncbi:RNA methyltransferase [Longibacter salinarum]|uniref:RNA methyltransferase n=1 Tax=Longibacter salinarum TaxID=1850348 RepID=A0A2A8CWH0_9BACT|nr:RNA methyltransferase [Longibacter salinarum]PEN13089.1 RNA methyltransferase [Longibacter salinarum]
MTDLHTCPLSNRRRKDIASLHRRKYRRRHGQTVVEGLRAVESALVAGAPVIDVVLTTEAAQDRAVRDVLANAGYATGYDNPSASGVTVWTAESEAMRELSGVESPQGILAVVERRYEDVASLIANLSEGGTLLALDGIQDPGNVGTIIRTAAWFGVSAIVAGPGTAGLYGPKVMRAGMGGHWDLSLARTDALGPALDDCRSAGYPIYGADLYGTSASDWKPQQPSVLVLGSEAHGLSAAVLDRLTEPVAIPGAPDRSGAESLNVAVASGILVYEWVGEG